MEVTLTYAELIVAGNAGVLRQVNALKRRCEDLDAHHRDPMEAHVAGAQAEWAVAKWLGVPFDPSIGEGFTRTVQAGDVVAGQPIEVRSTSIPNGCLICHNYSFDERPYVLVDSSRAPIYRMVGWTLGRDAKDPRYWRENVPRPAYFVPQGDLRPLRELTAEPVAA
jgi:hypothetical protein